MKSLLKTVPSGASNQSQSLFWLSHIIHGVCAMAASGIVVLLSVELRVPLLRRRKRVNHYKEFLITLRTILTMLLLI